MSQKITCSTHQICIRKTFKMNPYIAETDHQCLSKYTVINFSQFIRKLSSIFSLFTYLFKKNIYMRREETVSKFKLKEIKPLSYSMREIHNLLFNYF